MKNSFTLLEVILSISLAAIISITSIYYLNDLIKFNKNNLENETQEIDLMSSKIFLQKNPSNLASNLSLDGKNLYFKNSILQDKITNFTLVENETYYDINFNTKNKEINWIIKK